jgi:hypothetical protein
MDPPPGIVLFMLNGSWLGLYPRDTQTEDAAVLLDGCGYPGFASAHNVASESAVDRAIEQAVSAGEALIKRPQKVFWGSYSGYVKDPDGFPGEAAHNPSFWVGLKTSREKASPMPPGLAGSGST